MKHPTRLVLTVSALTALLCACQSETPPRPASANGASHEPAATSASSKPVSPAATATAEAPTPKAETQCTADGQCKGDKECPPGMQCDADKHGTAEPVAAPAATAAAPSVAPATTESAAAAVVVEKPVAEPATQPSPAVTDGYEVGQRIPSYKNTVHRPGAGSAEGQPFDTRATTKPTLYIANSTTCPYTKMYVDRMKALETAYMAKGVDVVHVYPVREQTAEAKAKHHAEQGFQGGIITDQDAAFAKALDIHKTPTVILADASGKIVYRGRIDDNMNAKKVHVNELADAIDATLAGKAVQVATTEPFG